MNIFLFDYDMKTNVESYCDSHVRKMLIEYAQMLSTACRLNGIDEGYKITHKNHPCNIWVRESLDNWLYLKDLSSYLHDEWCYRYNHLTDGKVHASFDVICNLTQPKINSIGLTEFKQCFPDKYKNDYDPVKGYRDYFCGEKQHIALWKNRPIPKWYKV